MYNKKILLCSIGFILIFTFAISSNAFAGEKRNFSAHLSGSSQIPAAVDTLAHGKAKFKLSKNKQYIHYRLSAANIENVIMAHIHMASEDANGPVVAWLFPATPPPITVEGRFDGVLAAGVITSTTLTGPLAGQTLQDLINAMSAGNTYVNVHTIQNGAGEIRGQIR